MFLRRTSARIALTYAAIFAASMVLISAAVLFSLYGLLRTEEDREIGIKLLGFWAQYRTGGVDAFMNEVNVDSLLAQERPFFVRLSGPDNQTLFLSAPQAWKDFPFQDLSRSPRDPDGVGVLRVDGIDHSLVYRGLRFEDANYLQVGVSTQQRDTLLSMAGRIFLLIAVPVLGLGVGVGFVFSAGILRPLVSITDTVRSIIDTGRLDQRVPGAAIASPGKPDELGRLVDLQNRMLAMVERLVAGMQETLDTVAHDIRTPLTRFRAQAEYGLTHADEEARKEALSSAVEESDRILVMLTTLLDITAAQTGVLQLNQSELDLTSLVRELADLYNFVGDDRSVSVSYTGPDTFVVRGDAARLRQVVGNLLDNAVKYSPNESRVEVAVSRTFDDRDRDYARVAVLDRGPGISLEDRDRIWKRLYRSPKVADQPGLGLGLSMAKAVVEAHGGGVGTEPRPGGGSVFYFQVPVRGAPAVAS